MDLLNKELSGPAYNNICLSNDHIDIISLETLWKYDDNNIKVEACEFDKELIFSYVDNGYIRCFNIKSLYNLIINGIYNDPYTNKPFDESIIDKINKKVKLLMDSGVSFDDTLELTAEQNINLKITEIFFKYDKFGLYLDINIFKSFTKIDINKIYNEGRKIWKAFKEDNSLLAHKIIPNLIGFNENLSDIDDLESLRIILLNEFDRFISSGIDDTSKKLGGYIVIGAMCYVNDTIKDTYTMILDGIN